MMPSSVKYFMQKAEECTLAGVVLLNISTSDFQEEAMNVIRKFLPVMSGVVVLGVMPSVQAKTASVMRRDPCSLLRVPVAEELLGGTIEKVKRFQGLDKWQECSASGKSPAARIVIVAVAPSNPTSGSLTAEFCKRYNKAKKEDYWADLVSWIPNLGLKAFNSTQTGVYVYTGSLLFSVYVSAPQRQRDAEVKTEGIALNDAKASGKLARAILQNVQTNANAPRPHCQ